jgi:hypothetical protein
MSISIITSALIDVTNAILPIIGNLAISLLLILVVLLIAKGLQLLVAYGMKLIMLDKALTSVGFTQFLTKGEIKKSPSELVGDFVYWLTVFISISSIVVVFGPSNSKELLNTLLGYSVSIIAAVFILALSLFLSSFIGSIIIVIANNVGLGNSRTMAKISQYGILVFGFIKALEIFGISSAIIAASFSVIVGAVGLAFAIAFGLGCKDIAGDFVTNLFKGK